MSAHVFWPIRDSSRGLTRFDWPTNFYIAHIQGGGGEVVGVPTSKASPFPLVLGIAATVTSVLLAVLIFIHLLPALAALAGWALTPLTVFAAFSWDFIAQRKGKARRRFRPSHTYANILRWLAYVSLPIAGAHIWVLAEYWSAI